MNWGNRRNLTKLPHGRPGRITNQSSNVFHRLKRISELREGAIDSFASKATEIKFVPSPVHFLFSYIKRFWKKPFFDLLDKLRTTLDRIYGEGKVTLIDASLRWMYHHSKMDGACGGKFN